VAITPLADIGHARVHLVTIQIRTLPACQIDKLFFVTHIDEVHVLADSTCFVLLLPRGRRLCLVLFEVGIGRRVLLVKGSLARRGIEVVQKVVAVWLRLGFLFADFFAFFLPLQLSVEVLMGTVPG
jgi:hypothetical protein